MDWLQDIYNYRIVGQYTDLFLRGMATTLWLSVIILALSLVFGVFLAIARMSSNPLLWRSAAVYIQFVRGTPMLIQIYLVYYGLPALLPFGNFLDETQTGIIALTLHSTPYMAEILRAGLESVDKGQIEAARSVGMSSQQTMTNITLPQAIATSTPPLLGQTAILIKDTSLLSIIAVFELMGAGIQMFADTVMAPESYLTVAVCYLAIYVLMLIFSSMVQNRLGGKAWQAN